MARLGAIAMAGVLVASCADVPDEANPARLFQSSDEEPPPGAGEEFPNLAEVPDEPRPSSTPEQIREVHEGLVADRANARYTDAELRNRSVDEVDFATASASSGETRRPLSAERDPAAAVAEAEEIARAAAAKAEAARAAVEAEAPAATSEVASPAPNVEAAPLESPAAEQPGQAGPATSLDGFKQQFADAFYAKDGALETAAAVPSSTIWFQPLSKAIGQEQRDALKEIAAAQARQGATILVIGRAPASAGADALAYDRALAAAAELEQLGVPVDRMRVFAGPADPSSDGAAPDRVDIFVE
ncbi:MAG: OmpA family protein [Alphaproteobacteria bacterium]